MSTDSELERLKWEASDERKKAVYSLTLKKTIRQERIDSLEQALGERKRAQEQVLDKARRLINAVREDPRLGTSKLDDDKLLVLLNSNPAIKKLQTDMQAIEDELATLQREGLFRLVSRGVPSLQSAAHPLRLAVGDGEGDVALRAIVSGAAAGRRFLSDAELRDVVGLVGAAQGAQGARIRRAAAAVLRDFSQTILEAAGEPARARPRARLCLEARSKARLV